MALNHQGFFGSALGVRLVILLGRIIPSWLGYKVTDWFADRISSRQESILVRTVRANQWVARGETLGKDALDRVTRETFRHTARNLYNQYHYMDNQRAIQRMVVLDASSQALFERPEYSARGLVATGLHLSSFALILQWLSYQNLKPLLLTIPDPHGGGQVEFDMRKKLGMNLAPASLASFRQAVSHLKKGGVVATGIDRPVSNPQIRPIFFGRPSQLPIHHIFLARQAEVPIVVFGINLFPDGKYHVTSSDPIEMDSFPDREKADRVNAEKVLAVAQRFIEQTPEQWSISLPIWPEVIDLAP